MMSAALSRRAVLAAAPLASLAPTLALAVPAEPEPVFAAIAYAVATDRAFVALEKGRDETEAVAVRVADEAADRSSDAMMALDKVIPTIAAGLHALIRHYAEDCARQDAYSVGAVCLQHLARCIGPPAPEGIETPFFSL